MHVGQSARSRSGLENIRTSSTDVKLLCLQRFCRLFAYGTSTLILANFLSDLDFTDRSIGLFMTATLWGDAILSLLLALIADRIGRRRMLVVGSLMMTASGVVFATTRSYWILLVASVFGVISPSGSEVGPFKAVEESAISQVSSPKERNTILAWYYMLGTWGSAAGLVSCGWTVNQLQRSGWTRVDSHRVIFWAYAVTGLAKCILSIMLSHECDCPLESVPLSEDERLPQPTHTTSLISQSHPEIPALDYGTVRATLAPGVRDPLLERDYSRISRRSDSSIDIGYQSASPAAPQNVDTISAPEQIRKTSPSQWDRFTPKSRQLLLKICLVLAFDNLGSGIIPESWQVVYFSRRFSIGEGPLGSLFFTSRLVSSFSNLISIPLARWLGLIPTIVFGNFSAAICLATIPFGPSIGVAAAFLIARACFLDIDGAPRQAFLAAAFSPTERTAAFGVINLVRTLCQSIGPSITGSLAGASRLWMCFALAGCLKVTYDVLLFLTFSGYRTQEEIKQSRYEDAKSAEWTNDSV